MRALVTRLSVGFVLVAAMLFAAVPAALASNGYGGGGLAVAAARCR